MAQLLRPDGDVTTSSWSGSYTAIDEVSADDADYGYSANGSAATFEFSLGNPSTPISGTCTFRYRIAQTNSGAVDGTGTASVCRLALFEGGTQIAIDSDRTSTGTWTQYSFTFAASAVTDWTDVRGRFTADSHGGSPGNRRGSALSWAELETPDQTPPPKPRRILAYQAINRSNTY